MAKPTWSISSNTNLGTFAERNTIAPINFENVISDLGDLSILSNRTITNVLYETDIFLNNVQTYCDYNNFYIKSNGLATTPWLGEPAGYDQYSPVAKNYTFKLSRLKIKESFAEIKTPALGFVGVAINGVPFKSPNSGKSRKWGTQTYTENSVIYPLQNYFENYFSDGSGIIGADRAFYYQSNPVLLNDTHPDGHSKILGYAFDGFPIYGPYGYTDPLDVNSGVSIIRSSYRIKSTPRVGGTLPDGTFIEDFEYVYGLGDLDQFNSRFCKTPDYPDGITAYFVTVDPYDTNIPRYPYIVGPYYVDTPILPNGGFDFPGDITLSLISGDLAPGLRLSNFSIVGTPYSVPGDTDFRFVIRAENLDGITDRTFYMTVTGYTPPTWLTPEGDLPVGTNNTYWILDNSPIEFQLSATYDVLPVGKEFNFYIPPLGGTLPPGISLSKDGVLSGFTQPVISVEAQDGGNGSYGMSPYDKYSYDYGVRPYNGYDSYLFDNVTFDFSEPTTTPRKLNRYYQFVVRADDGLNYVDRKFRIFVVSDDHLRADNTIMQAGTGIFTADDTFLRKPIWITSPYLGVRRANNYITIPLKVYTSATLVGTIGFVQAPVNNEVIVKKASWVDGNHVTLTNGTSITSNTIYVSSTANLIVGMNVYITSPTSSSSGKFATNTKVTSINIDGHHFTVSKNVLTNLSNATIYAVSTTASLTVYPTDIDGEIVAGYHIDGPGIPSEAVVSDWDPNTNSLLISWDSANDLKLSKSKVLRLGTTSTLPPGMVLDQLNGSIYGDIPYQTSITKNYKFTVKAIRYDPVTGDTIDSYRTFNVDIIGEIDSTIRFTTAGDLGSIPANMISKLSVSATTTIKNAVLRYTVIGGKLPPGLFLAADGTIQGKVNQFASGSKLGLTTFDQNDLRLDGSTTTVDRQYKFLILAVDQFNLSSTTKVFTLLVTTPNDRLYSNVYVKPFLKLDMRSALNDFFINPDIFEPQKIYRSSDPEFGIQNELKMLLYPGIETKVAVEYVSAFGRTARKRFRIGNIKKAIAKEPLTDNTVYEVVYLEILDNLENEKGTIADIDTKLLNHPISVNQSRRDVTDGDLFNNREAARNRDQLPVIPMQDKVMTADFTGQNISDINKTSVFANSVMNIRKNIAKIGDTERNFMPLWMRTAQSYTGIEQGFTRAIVLCYCKPGYANDIILNIKNSNFDFKLLDLTIDRAIIDSVTGEDGAKYIMFPAREVIND